MDNQQQTSLTMLRQTKETQQVAIGFDTQAGFELLTKAARNFSQAPFVPEAYRGDAGIGACTVAIDMAIRMKAAPLMVMQNLYLVNGKPGWSAQWCIAQVNNCGRFSPLEYEIVELGQQEFEYLIIRWENKQRVYDKKKITLNNFSCIAYATELRTGKIIKGVAVTMEMAVKEGWYGKDGSKWQTMPELMARYRAASFFCKLYAPELLMGLQTAEELHDIIDVNQAGEIVGQTKERLKRKPKDVTPENENAAPVTETVITDQETGEIIEEQRLLTPEEMNQAMEIIDEITTLRKTKSAVIEAKLPAANLAKLDADIVNFFDGVSLHDLIVRRDFILGL